MYRNMYKKPGLCGLNGEQAPPRMTSISLLTGCTIIYLTYVIAEPNLP